MAHPNDVDMGAKPPKVLENIKYKVKKDVLSTVQDIIPTSSVLPAYQDRIDRANGKCINLSLIKLHFKLFVRDRKEIGGEIGSDNAYDYYSKIKTIVPGNPYGTLFSDVVIRLNGTPVTNSNGLFPYVCNHLFLTKVAPVYRKACEESCRVYHDYQVTNLLPNLLEDDSAFTGRAGFDPILFKDSEIRAEKYQINSKYGIDLSTYLFTDLTASRQAVVVPPNVAVDIELHFNSPKRSILMDKIGPIEPVCCITQAELIVPRVTPAVSIPKSISHQFMSVSAQPIFIPKSTTNQHTIVTFNGPVPSRLTLLFASMNSFDGNYWSNMYASYHYNVEKISFNIGGQIYPAAPIDSHFNDDNTISQLYLRTAESLRFSLERTGLTLPSRDLYSANQFIYSCDVSPDFSCDSTWTHPDHDGSVAISIHFAQPTHEQIVGILLTETVNTLQINHDGAVTVD